MIGFLLFLINLIVKNVVFCLLGCIYVLIFGCVLNVSVSGVECDFGLIIIFFMLYVYNFDVNVKICFVKVVLWFFIYIDF